jgi:hypothetical protein
MDGRDQFEARDPVRELAEGDVSGGALASLTRSLAGSAKAAGAGAVASGRWLANTVLDLAPRVPVRSHEALVAQHNGLSGPALAYELVRRATRNVGLIGAASGALIGLEELAPPAWLTVPIELVAETVAIAIIEMKLIAELHEVYGRPVPGTATERGAAIVRAWAERRGVTAAGVATGGGLATLIGRGTRDELTRLIRRRIFRRMTGNLASLAPLMAGAAAGAAVNRRATRALGDAVARDLARRPGASTHLRH